MNRRFTTYCLALLLGGLLQATVCFAENADVTYTVWHGRRGTGEYASFDHIDPSYVVVGPRGMDFSHTPALSRTDLTQYSVLSGEDGDATKVLFQYTPTADFPLFYLYFAIEEYGGFGGHVYPYTSIYIYEGADTIGCSFYSEYTENGVKDGFIFDSQASFLQYYRPWDIMAYDFSAYIGKTLTIEVVATCCSNHHCWTHLYTAFEKARVEDVCGNCDENRLVAPTYSNPVWRKGSATGPMVSGDEIFTITHDMVDDYYCTLSTYCGPETFLLGAAMDVISDFSYRTYCYNDNDTVFLTNNSYMLYRTSQTRVPCDTALWTFEGGEKSSVIDLPYIVFPIAGKYTISLRMGSEKFKCDSTITKEVPYGLQNYINLVDSICQEDLPYRWRDKEYRQTGDYTDTIPASTGCDSVLHLLLTVLDTTVSTTTYTICEGETITWNGKKYSAAGVYRDTLVNAAGCDSLLTLNIKYKSCSEGPGDRPIDPMPFIPVRDSLDTTICIGDTLIWHNVPYWRDTTVRDTGYYSWYPLDSVYWVLILHTEECGCDTAYSHTYTNIKEEDLPYTWNNQTLPTVPQNPRQDTILVAPLQKFDLSCDSIATLHLHVLFPCELPTETLPVTWKRKE